MNEIEKLYELADIRGKWVNYETETTDGCINLGSKLTYPPFTAEKQIELMLFYVNKGEKLEFEKNGNKNLSKEVLINAIAGLACRLWQDLTKEEKAEIKKILEG